MNNTTPEISAKLSRSARASIEMIAVALPAFWSMIQLYSWWKPPLNSLVFAVMLGVMLPRAMKRVKLGQLYFAVLTFAIGTMAAIGCGMLIENDGGMRILGAALFAVGVAAPVWARRFGGVWKALGTLFTIPFMAILVHPVAMDLNIKFFGWELIAAAIALAWTSIAKALAGGADMPYTPEAAPASTAKKHELLSSTKMAVQLAVAVAVAFACAELVDAEHLVWPVLTVLIVHSGNNGRGDLLWKGAQRTAGALIGVTLASLFVIDLPSKSSIEIVAIFVILVIAAFVREFGYIFWAICIPAALVLLYSFFGQSGAELTAHLAHRLLGITIGSAVGIASGYFIFPVRMTDIVRLRLSTLLSAASDYALAAARGEAAGISLAALAAADNELSHFNGVAKAARYLGFGAARRLYGAVAGAHGLAGGLGGGDAPLELAGFAALARQIGLARRSLSSDVTGADTPECGVPEPFAANVQAIIAAGLSPGAKRGGSIAGAES